MTAKDLDQEIRELLNSPFFWIFIIILILMLIILIIIFLYEFFSNRIHRSYHKGYNEAKSDKIQYYSTIHEIIDKFKEIYKCFENVELKGHTALLINDFRDYLDNKYSN